VTKFCLALEEFRRTDAGRVKNAKELVEYFFPHDASKASDRLFIHMPREVRAPVVAAWGIRGAKAALRDDDDRVRSVIHDAMLAGDIDEAAFEEGVTPGHVTDWVPLPEWWAFWRAGKVTGVPVQKALATARDLELFDDRWFLENVDGRGGRLKGTDTLCDTLSKDQIVAWVRNIHASGNGSPAGIIGALTWETVLAKTSQEALLFALDALAKKIGLVAIAPQPAQVQPAQAAQPAEPAQAAEPAPSGVRGSEVPGIAIPDFPMEEKGVVEDDMLDIPSADSSWPELAAPGDMGYALSQAPAAGAPSASAKPLFDEEDATTPLPSGNGTPAR
jgi:hypothetical protein